MYDPCWVSVTCRKQDVEAFERELGPANTEDLVRRKGKRYRGVRSLVFEDVNYAGDEARQRIAELGIPFVGYNDAGKEYGPSEFVACDGKTLDMPLWEGNIVLMLDRVTLLPTLAATQALEAYKALRTRACEALGIPVDAL